MTYNSPYFTGKALILISGMKLDRKHVLAQPITLLT